MPLLSMSRQLGSLGTEIAVELARQMGLKVVDKNAIETALIGMGVPEARVEQYDERKPGFWQLFSAEKDRYLHFLKTAVLRFARDMNAVIIGRGGQALFHGVPGVLKVRTIASPEVRIPRIAKRFTVTEDRARQILQRNDLERAGYHRFFFNVAWEADHLYDLVINTDSLSEAEAVEILGHGFASPLFKARSDETRRKIEDLCLVQEVITAIVYEERIPTLFLEVAAVDGHVTVTGAVQVASSVQRCAEVARAVTGVRDVENRMEVVSYYLGV